MFVKRRISIVAIALASAFTFGACAADEASKDKIKVSSADDVNVNESGGGGSTTTIPVDEAEAGGMFGGGGIGGDFNDCLEKAGYEFIGAPGFQNGDDPAVNDPDYLEAIQKCGNESGATQRYEQFQNVMDSMTPEQVKAQNEQGIKVMECLEEEKGWTIPELAPRANGLLMPSDLTAIEVPEGHKMMEDVAACGFTGFPGMGGAADDGADTEDADATTTTEAGASEEG